MKVYIDCNDKNQRKAVFAFVRFAADVTEKNHQTGATINLDYLRKIEAVMERQEEIIEEQEERIAIMSEGGWHKITDSLDSLPKESGEYIVDIELTFIGNQGEETTKRVPMQMFFYEEEQAFKDHGVEFHPTYWMKMPKVPEEGEQK